MSRFWERLMPGEGRAADRAALAAMAPFKRRGSNLWAVYGAVSDLGYLQWVPSLHAYRSNYLQYRAQGNIAYTVLSYRTPIAWVRVDRGAYPDTVHVARNPCWSRTTNNHRAVAASALAIDQRFLQAQYDRRYAFNDMVYDMRTRHADAQQAAQRAAQAEANRVLREREAALAEQRRAQHAQWLEEQLTNQRERERAYGVSERVARGVADASRRVGGLSDLMRDALAASERFDNDVPLTEVRAYQNYHNPPRFPTMPVFPGYTSEVRRVTDDGHIVSEVRRTMPDGTIHTEVSSERVMEAWHRTAETAWLDVEMDMIDEEDSR